MAKLTKERKLKCVGSGLRKAIDECIEYCNSKRVQHKLKGLTPFEARNQALSSR
ncbi:MAG: IS3 family transposase [Erysipelotrichaceae bacterium]|nr:IS3 family transposase [Erysipelotrichaceae bacterium]